MGNAGSTAPRAAEEEKKEESTTDKLAGFGMKAMGMFGGGSGSDNDDEQADEGARELEIDPDLLDEFDGMSKQAREAEEKGGPEDDIDEEEEKAENADLEAPAPEGEILERGMSVKPWLGAMAKPTGFQWGATDAKPDVTLELEHVYGYRGNRCRNNVIWIDEKTILYYAAAVGIVHNLETNKQKFFRMHTDDIISMDFHRESRTVVTGEQGKLPAIYTWDVDTCEKKGKFAGFHKRAVVSISFSPDGKYIATVGLDDAHSVAIYDWQTGDLVGKSKGDTNKILHLAFNPEKPTEFVTVGVKHVKFWSCPDCTGKNGIIGKMGARQPYMVAAYAKNHAIVGCQNGEIYVFANNKLIQCLPAHDGAIFALRTFEDVVVTGGRDGKVSLWDPATFKKTKSFDFNTTEPTEQLGKCPNNIRSVDLYEGKLVVGTVTNSISTIDSKAEEGVKPERVLNAHHGDLDAPQNYGELWGLSTHPSDPTLVASASDDSTCRIWNLGDRKEILRAQLPGPARCCAFHPKADQIAVGLLSGDLVVINSKTGSIVTKVPPKKAKHRIQCIKFSPSGKLLATGNAEMSCDLYAVDGDKYTFKHRCKGNSSVILHVDFSEDETYVQTCSQAYELLFYNTADGTQFTQSRSLKDTKWDTFTSILGWDVQGIWPKESDYSDVNSVGRSHDSKLLATAEDTGLIKVFQYPCVGSGLDRKGKLLRRPHSIREIGHSSHVTDVQWTVNDDRLISTGGGDLSVFQWKVTRGGEAKAE